MPQRQWRWQCHSADAAADADDNDEYETQRVAVYGDGVDLFKALQPNRNCQIHPKQECKKSVNEKNWKPEKKRCDL